MSTDWNLIRKMINTAVDACEAIDQLNIRDEERAASLIINDQPVATVWDALQSAYVFPESQRYLTIRARGQLGEAAPFVDPVSRVLQQVGLLAAELVGVQQLDVPVKGVDAYRPEQEQSIAGAIDSLCYWYENYFVPHTEDAIRRARHEQGF